MSEHPALHQRLIARQSDAELERKWEIARGRHSNQLWAQEWLDLADRRAKRLYHALQWDKGADHDGRTPG